MRYGDIYWAKADPGVGSEQSGRRPVLVVSSDDAIDVITTVVTTIPLTTRERGWTTHIPVSGAGTGLAAASWAMCEQIRTISTARLAAHVGRADAAALARVTTVLRYLLKM